MRKWLLNCTSKWKRKVLRYLSMQEGDDIKFCVSTSTWNLLVNCADPLISEVSSISDIILNLNWSMSFLCKSLAKVLYLVIQTASVTVECLDQSKRIFFIFTWTYDWLILQCLHLKGCRMPITNYILYILHIVTTATLFCMLALETLSNAHHIIYNCYVST